MALARVCFTLGAYFGLARKVSSPGDACSIPATPLISLSPSPINSQPSAFAMSRSFMVKLQVTVLAAARGLIVVR
jgi:hypothetical protein